MKDLTGNDISIVVLPFKNISNNEEMDFFSDGITEEIIFALSKVKQLKVISRTSSFYFKNNPIPIREIGKRLEVNIILEGSVRINKDVLRISARLIKAEEDTYLWSETWNRKLENLFEIQDEISLLIADKVREHMGHLSISEHLVEKQTSNLTAYHHYLKGRYHFYKWNPEDTNLAIKEFEQAVSLDNKMINAHLGIADTYSFMAVAGFAPRESAWARAIKAMDIAKEIDENNPGLNYMLANKAFFTDADYNAAKQFVLKSLQHAPTFEKSHRFISFLYALNDEFKKAEQHLFYAKSIDPFNPETSFYEAFFYHRTNQHQLANNVLNQLLATNPMNLPAIIISIYLKIKEGKWFAAQQQIEAAPAAIFTPDERLGLLSMTEVAKGNRTSEVLTQLTENAKEDTAHHAHSYLFIIYSMLEEYEKAYEILQNLFKHKSSILLLSFSNPLCKNLKTTNWYQDYAQKIYHSTAIQLAPKTEKSEKIEELSHQEDLEKLNAFVTNEQPFLNPMLTLRILANSVNIHPNQLSWLLNQVIGKNFNEFINQKRIEHFKKLVINPANAHISIIGLAYESGFNSKTVFNTAFKKEVGMTPKAYQKTYLK